MKGLKKKLNKTSLTEIDFWNGKFTGWSYQQIRYCRIKPVSLMTEQYKLSKMKHVKRLPQKRVSVTVTL